MLLGEAGSLLGYHSPAQAGGQAAGQVMTAGYQNLEQREIMEGFLEEGYQVASPRLSSRVPGGRGLAGVGGQERYRVSTPPGGSGPARALENEPSLVEPFPAEPGHSSGRERGPWSLCPDCGPSPSTCAVPALGLRSSEAFPAQHCGS